MESPMESSSVELKIMFCRDLKAFNFFQKLSVYTVVSISTDDPNEKKEKHQQQQRTPTDKEGDGNPEWNHQIKFDLEDSLFQSCEGFFLHFDLRARGIGPFGDKSIGEVRVPLEDVIGESHGVTRFVNYEVRTSDGKPNGILNFSYKVNCVRSPKPDSTSSVNPKIDGFPFIHHLPNSPSARITNTCSGSEIQYPRLDLHDSFSASQEIQYDFPGVQHVSHGVQCPPSLHGSYYHPPPAPWPWPPPPPPPPPMYHRMPPAQGGFPSPYPLPPFLHQYGHSTFRDG